MECLGGGGTVVFLFPQDFGVKFSASGGGVGFLRCQLGIVESLGRFRIELFEKTSVGR